VRLVPIGELVESIDRGGPPRSTEEFTYIDLGSVDADLKRITSPASISVAAAPSRARQRLRSGDVLVSTVRPNLNGVATVPAELDGSIGSTGFAVLRPKADELDERYLFHWVRSQPFVGAMTAFATGASYPAVTDRIVKQSRIPLPPLAEQRRIATILDQADALRKAAGRAARLVKEVAREVTSGALRSSDGRRALRDLGVTISSGLSVGDGGDTPHPINRVLKVSAVSRGTFDSSETKPMPRDYAPPAAHKVHPQDLLMTRASGSVDLIARSTFVDEVAEDVYLPDKIWRVSLAEDSPLSLRLLDGLTREPEFRAYVANASSGASGVRNISQAKVLAFEAPVPDEAAVRAADEILDQLEQHARIRRKRAAGLDALFASLQHRAFCGEL